MDVFTATGSACRVSSDSKKNALFDVCLCRLKIDEMTVDDSGTYTCVGFNQYGRQSTNGSVFVRQGKLSCITPYTLSGNSSHTELLLVTATNYLPLLHYFRN